MARPLRPDPKGVLVFNPQFILIAIAKSINSVAKLTGSYPTSIWLAVNGKLNTSNNLYFRTIPDNIEIDIADLNSLTLQDFDKMCGIERVYINPNLLVKRKKRFNTKKTTEQNEAN